MCKREWLLDNSGFSLVEVILAVAILALVSLPLMNYFTYSGVQTAHGRDKQTANIIAENTLEELKSYNNFEQIEKLDEDGVWTVDNTNPLYTDMEKTVNQNNFDFDVKVHIDYDTYDAATKTLPNAKLGTSEQEIDSEYNDYHVPNPTEVYSTSNIVASEDDELDVALGEFYINNKATVTRSTIMANMTRTLCVDVKYKNPATKDMYVVKVFYRYSYNGEDIDVYLEEGYIEVEKLQNIFVFYNLLRSDVVEEPIEITFSSDIPDDSISKLKIYLAAQKSDSVTKPSGYVLLMTAGSSANAKKAKFFTNNNDASNFELAKKADGSLDSFVTKDLTKRVGRVTVKVYEPGDTKEILSVESSLAE